MITQDSGFLNYFNNIALLIICQYTLTAHVCILYTVVPEPLLGCIILYTQKEKSVNTSEKTQNRS